jgi:nitrate reductase NapAB chaperone NapD
VPILSYVVIPSDGATGQVAGRLASLPGCEVARAANRDLLLLVTETGSEREERELHAALSRVEGIRSMILTFGALA